MRLCFSMQLMSGIPIRDEMYAQGIEFGDYVVNEFLNRAGSILDEPIRKQLAVKLKAEIATHRQYCLDTMEKALFIKTPISNTPSTPATPRDVSKSILAALKASPLPLHTFAGASGSENIDIIKQEDPLPRTDKHPTINISEELDDLSGNMSSTPRELRIFGDNVYKSNAPMKVFGVLDFNKVAPKRKYQSKKRRKSLGCFEKDGSYHATAYGGFVHLCGGALEWPFKTAEINFSDFYQID